MKIEFTFPPLNGELYDPEGCVAYIFGNSDEESLTRNIIHATLHYILGELMGKRIHGKFDGVAVRVFSWDKVVFEALY